MKWSYSGLKDFVNCPKQYYEVKVAKNFVKEQTKQMLYGTEVHKALEDYARDKTPLPQNYKRFQKVMDVVLEIPGIKYPERKFALTAEKLPCDFSDANYWVRGIVDLLIIEGTTAFVLDYKTGSAKYPDPKQLKLMALMTFAHHPNVERVRAGLLFVAHNHFLPEEYDRKDIEKLWSAFTPELARMKVSYDTNNWPENPTGLCGWCPVVSCAFNRMD